ncbi:GIY-YIG nuclease family protein [Aestuariivirga litoralis]|uniref:GIY-YIG nuclease family protein n=1 Tax=Aestuariivirga litoralis TaxID=2650924 RepID=UPI0032B10E93
MKTFTDEDAALLDELGIEPDAKPSGGRSAREERIIAGFEEIQRFVEKHGRSPQHSEEGDIFERLYAVRLDRLRDLADCRALLEPFDTQSLLAGHATAAKGPNPVDLDDDALLAELGAETPTHELTELKHVRSASDKREAEEIANRQKCEDFESFRPLFEKMQRELKDGVRISQQFRRDAGFLKADIAQGNFFILNGQTAYVADVGEPIKAPNGEYDARLRVIYSNGTESNLLLRSLQRALYKDEAGRRISEPTAGPLFSEELDEDDQASGTIYVLRSKSDHPLVKANRELVHKIGVTSGSVEKRIAGANQQTTYLLADVEVVATYQLFNISRAKLENLIHRVFDPARLEIEIIDRLGRPIVPREWFLVPIFIIDEAVERIKNSSIVNYVYDPASATLKAKS